MARVEEAYTWLLKNGDLDERAPRLTMHIPERVMLAVGSRTFYAEIVRRPSAIWRQGRIFYRGPKCGRRATRLYVPLEDSQPGCRRCWGHLETSLGTDIGNGNCVSSGGYRERCVVVREPDPVVFAGDAFGGPRIESAVLSTMGLPARHYSISWDERHG